MTTLTPLNRLGGSGAGFPTRTSAYTAYCGSWAEHRANQVDLCHPLIAKAISVFLTNFANLRNPPTAPSGKVLRQGSHAPKVETRFV
jgi:hypothetical protein